MPKIKFSHIFNDNLERIYEGFKRANSLAVEFKKLISNLKFHKGNDLDEINAEFSLCYKNYYHFNFIVENVIQTPFFRSIVHKTISIDELPIIMTFTYNFYWDSINNKTIFIIEIEYQDEFFTDLIKNEFRDEDMLNICNYIEKYLSTTLKGLDSGYSCVLNAPLDEIKKYILFPKLFFHTISKDMIFVINEEEIALDRRYEIFSKGEKTSENVLLTEFIIETLVITEKYIKVGYTTYKKSSFPDIRFAVTFKELANKTVFYTFFVKPNESLGIDAYRKILKFWKKRMNDFYKIFEKGII